MIYCNELNKLSVLSLYEGDLIGVVDKLYFDKRLKKLIELELIGENGAKLILPTKNIYHIGKNAITVKNNQMVNLGLNNNEHTTCPIGVKAFSIKGEFLGVISEISLDEKFLAKKISLDNNSAIDIARLTSVGKNAIVFSDANKINVNKFSPEKTPKNFKSEIVQVAEVLPVEKVDEQVNNIVPNIQNSDFLLGRICLKDIFNFNNELLIKSHAIINKKNLKEINKYGKLRELMLYSK